MLKNMLLLLISSLISLAALELVLRVLMPERLAFVPALYNGELTYLPDQWQRSRHLEWDYDVTINADGFRNDRTADSLPAGTILALGDSFTEGYGVALEDAYPKLLEQLLEREGGTAHVYNAGHYDTGLPTYRAVYHAFFRENPTIDRVIIGLFVGNDVLRTAKPGDGRLLAGNEFGDGWRYRLKVFLGSHVAIYAVANHTIKTNPVLFKLCQRLGACYHPHPPNIYDPEVIARVTPLTVGFVRDFVTEIRADGRQAVVLLIPTREQTNEALWQAASAEYGGEAADNRHTLNVRIADELRSAGIDVIELGEPAARYEREQDANLYFRYDGHWNPAGHRFAADALARFLSPPD